MQIIGSNKACHGFIKCYLNMNDLICVACCSLILHLMLWFYYNHIRVEYIHYKNTYWNEIRPIYIIRTSTVAL